MVATSYCLEPECFRTPTRVNCQCCQLNFGYTDFIEGSGPRWCMSRLDVMSICNCVVCITCFHSLSLTHSLTHSLTPSLSSLFSLFSQDETLVHCSLSPLENPEFTFDVEFEGEVYDVSVPTCIGGWVIYPYGIVLAGQCSIKTILQAILGESIRVIWGKSYCYSCTNFHY